MRYRSRLRNLAHGQKMNALKAVLQIYVNTTDRAEKTGSQRSNQKEERQGEARKEGKSQREGGETEKVKENTKELENEKREQQRMK